MEALPFPAELQGEVLLHPEEPRVVKCSGPFFGAERQLPESDVLKRGESLMKLFRTQKDALDFRQRAFSLFRLQAKFLLFTDKPFDEGFNLLFDLEIIRQDE